MSEENKVFNPDTDAAWYVVGCMSGRDNKVYETLTAKKNNGDWNDVLLDVVCPTEIERKTRTLKSGEVKVNEKKHMIYAGYVFVHCVMTNELWFEIRNTPGVTGLIGSHGKGSKPTPMTEKEINPILRMAGREVIDEGVDYNKGDEVVIAEGPFAGKKCKVISVDTKQNLAKVEINMMGKDINLEMVLYALQKE